jgi:hypothetical protein
MVTKWGLRTGLLIGQRLQELDAAPSLAQFQLLPHVRITVVGTDETRGLSVCISFGDDAEIQFQAMSADGTAYCDGYPWDVLTRALITGVMSK